MTFFREADITGITKLRLAPLIGIYAWRKQEYIVLKLKIFRINSSQFYQLMSQLLSLPFEANKEKLNNLFSQKLSQAHYISPLIIISNYYFVGGAVASWFVRRTPDRTVGVLALTGALRCVLEQDTLLP